MMSRVIPGLILAAVGVLLTLQNLDLLDISGLWRFWPLILVALGLSVVLDRSRRQKGLGMALLIVGSLLQLVNLDILDLTLKDIRRYWPVLLMVVGAAQILRLRRGGSLGAGLVLLGLGIYFQLSNLGMIRYSLLQLWPIALIAIGIGMVYKAMARRSSPQSRQ